MPAETDDRDTCILHPGIDTKELRISFATIMVSDSAAEALTSGKLKRSLSLNKSPSVSENSIVPWRILLQHCNRSNDQCYCLLETTACELRRLTSYNRPDRGHSSFRLNHTDQTGSDNGRAYTNPVQCNLPDSFSLYVNRSGLESCILKLVLRRVLILAKLK